MIRATKKLVLANQLSEIHRLSDAVDEFAARHKMADQDCFKLNLVLDEVLTNVISYGFPEGAKSDIEVELILDDNKIVAVVFDGGTAFNPLNRPAPDIESGLEERSVGGLGIHFAKTLMDDVEYWRQGDKNCLLLVKRFDNLTA